MKKNLLKKVLALALSATMALTPVVSYAGDEVVEEVVWEETAQDDESGEQQSSGDEQGDEASEDQLYSDEQSYSGETTVDEPEVIGFEENEEDNASDETYYAFSDVVNEDASEDNEVDFVSEDVYYAENQDIYEAIGEDVSEEQVASDDTALFGDEVISEDTVSETVVNEDSAYKTTNFGALVTALRNVTKDNPLLDNAEALASWPDDTPVCRIVDDTTVVFYSKIDDGDKVGSYNTISGYTDGTASVTVYCRPGAEISANSKHWFLNTSITIYGNGATLNSAGNEPDLGSYFDMTTARTINIYNLNGVGIWGSVDAGAQITINVENCNNAHEVLVQGGTASSNVATTVKKCTFDQGNGAHKTGISQDCGGSVTIEDCSFSNMLCGINIKNDTGNLKVNIKDCTFTNCGLSANTENKDSNVDLGASIRIGSKAGATNNVTIDKATITTNGERVLDADIIIGDNRKGKDGYGTVTYTVKNTSGTLNVANIHKNLSSLTVSPAIEVYELNSNTEYSGNNANFYQDADTATTWHVANLTGLKAFRDNVNATVNNNGNIIALNNYKNHTIYLENPVDLNNETWEPIGNYLTEGKVQFSGIFDGKNNVISNLKIISSEKNNLGLFGMTTDATLRQIKVENVNLEGNDYIGAIAGRAYSTTTVEYCEVLGKINLSGNHYVGGITGSGYATVKNCKTLGENKVTCIIHASDHKANAGDGDDVGGIIGLDEGNTQNIENCEVSNVTLEGFRQVGGIAGLIQGGGLINNCTVSNVIVKCIADEYTAANKDWKMGFGGIVGMIHNSGVNGVSNSSVTNVSLECEEAGVSKARMGYVSGGLYYHQKGDDVGFLIPATSQNTGSNITVGEGVGRETAGLMKPDKEHILLDGPFFVAQINEGAKYATLEEAIEQAATSGDTIKLLTDIDLTAPVATTGKDFMKDA